MDKKEIRQYISAMKKKMTGREIEELSGVLSEFFFSLPEYKESECIAAYMSYNQEVRTDAIIDRSILDGKRVAVPVVKGKEMEFRYINSLSDCEIGTMGIKEPTDKCTLLREDEKSILLLMPGLAFDPEGNRIGYGGGYYDRYLLEHPEIDCVKVAMGYDFQLINKLEAEEFDQKADIIITPSQVIRI